MQPAIQTQTDSAARCVEEVILDGIPASPGVAIGPARIITPTHQEDLEPHLVEPADVELELVRFRDAAAGAARELARVEELAREQVQDRARIFEALRMMLDDPVLLGAIEEHIRSRRSTATNAVVAEMTRLADVFLASNDALIRSRAEDVRALQTHLIACLSNSPLPSGVHHDAVLVLHSLSPRDLVVYARGHAAAFLLESGGINSHAAILARSFAVPMVAAVHGITRLIDSDDPVIVDGYTGRVIIHPAPETIAHYRTRKASLEIQRERYRAVRKLPAETRDGDRFVLASNLDMADEIEAAIENGADEIGLMRTEYLVMDRDGDISMEDQLEYYRQIAERAYPMDVAFRAFDIGTEKLAGGAWGGSYSSPLGMRGIRLLLARPEILRRQIEALLRASVTRNVRLMLPMVTSTDEVRRVRALVDEVRAELRAASVEFDDSMPVGTMIEVPAAALTAEAIAGQSDFLSIGTNDLAQYTLAVDRDDEALDGYYDDLNPAVLKLVRHTVVAARRAGVPVTICGELAANPLATALLIGMGLRRFSVPPQQIAPLKLRIRALTTRDAHEIARAVLRMATAAEVRAFLTERFGEIVE